MNYFFIRHIRSLGNITPSLYFTHNDHEIDICEDHIHQAAHAAEKVVDLYESLIQPAGNWYLYHSPFLRTRRTKDFILKELEHHYMFPIVRENPLLSERSWGNLKNLVDIAKDTDEFFHFFYQPDNGGESFAQCYQRCVTFDNMLKNKVGEDDNVIIVGHGEHIKCYLMHLLGWTLEEFDSYKNPENCEVILVKDGKLSSQTPLKIRIKI